MSAARPIVFSATVLPPAFGPLTTIARRAAIDEIARDDRLEGALRRGVGRAGRARVHGHRLEHVEEEERMPRARRARGARRRSPAGRRGAGPGRSVPWPRGRRRARARRRRRRRSAASRRCATRGACRWQSPRAATSASSILSRLPIGMTARGSTKSVAPLRARRVHDAGEALVRVGAHRHDVAAFALGDDSDPGGCLRTST